MPQKPVKVIIDTNLWISFLISKSLKEVDQKILSGDVKLIFSQELLEEFLTVVSRAKFNKYFSQAQVESLIDLFDVYARFVTVKSNVQLCRDPKDNFLLSLAHDSKADFLVTGDSDLLELSKINRTRIVTFQQFTTLI